MKLFGKTMNEIIDEVVMEYKNDSFEIDYVCSSLALEAETVDAGNGSAGSSPQMDDSSFTSKLLNKIKEIITTLRGILSRIAQKLKNAFTKFFQSDNGFIDNCRKAMVERKPLQGVKLITYQYNDQSLDTIMNKLSNSTMNVLRNFSTGYQDMKDSSNVGVDGESDVVKKILTDAGIPDEYNKDVNQLFLYLKDAYRKEKKETLFVASNAKVYYSIAVSSDKIRSYANGRKNELQSLTNNMQSRLETFAKSTANQDIKRNSIKQLHNVSKVFNLYSRILEIYVQLKIEKALSYRAVLKKLYHF